MAVVPEDCVRVQMNWSLLPDEIAVSTFAMKLEHGVGLTVDWEEIVGIAAEKIHTKWVSAAASLLKPYIADHVKLKDVSVYHLDAATGHALDRGRYGLATPWSGSSSSALPNECAVAVSLYAYTPGAFTAFPRRHRGRMYLPPMGVGILEDTDAARKGRLSTAAQGNIATGMKNFLSDVHRMSKTDGSHVPFGGDDYWSVGVISKTDIAHRRLETVRVGDIVDVQRRRRNKQREVYTDRSVPDS